jgi:amino acid transporter
MFFCNVFLSSCTFLSFFKSGSLPSEHVLGLVYRELHFFWRMSVILPLIIHGLISCRLDMVHAFGGTITQWNTRLIGFAALTSVTLLHIFHLNWGLRLQNTLALVQIGIMFFLVMCGLLAFLGWIPLDHRPHNFNDLWKGTTHDPNAFVSGLYNVIW